MKCLSMNKNKLTNLEGLSKLVALEELSVAENPEFTSIKGIKLCNKLKKLNLNQTKVEVFDEVPDLPALEEISMV